MLLRGRSVWNLHDLCVFVDKSDSKLCMAVVMLGPKSSH